jgi:uncharacterized repeat protein (TIGR03803 family)
MTACANYGSRQLALFILPPITLYPVWLNSVGRGSMENGQWSGTDSKWGFEMRHIAKFVLGVVLICAVVAVASASVTFKSLVSFDGTNGSDPTTMTLVQGIDGELYGTTQFGGTENLGTVFKINSAGTLTTLWSFCTKPDNGVCPDGEYPVAGLTLVPGGDLYGTTRGGNASPGTIFKITPAGELTVVHTFCAVFGCTDGLNPEAPLLLAADGNLYGTTVLGGVGGCGGCHGGGTAFKIGLGGTFTKIHDFCTGTCTDYGNPSNALVQASDGNLYSEILGRSGYYNGNVFRMTTGGTVTILYTFCKLTNCTDGVFPQGGLVQGANGNLYGTTSGGGEYNAGEFFEISLGGGSPTVLHSFDYVTAGNLGSDPNSGVILGNDGNFYGVAYQGGTGPCTFACGTVFKLTPAGALTTLHSLDGSPDGNGPWGLMQDTSGSFYGTTDLGASTSNAGNVYTLSDGLGGFVKLVTTNGKVGTTVDILGEGFTGATGVTFDGVKATFDNVSNTFLTAIVPTGALTGSVTVTTFTSTYKSSAIFKVTPQFTSFSPAAGAVGSTVTMTGVSLTQTSSVTIGGLAATFKVVSDKEVTAVVPAGAKNAQNIVITTAGGSASKGPFAVEPKIASFTPTSGPAGTEVKISGTTLTGTSKVTFDGVEATSFEVINDSQVDVVVPSGAKTGTIQVTTPGGTATSTTSFTVN